ncbi:lytic murein transglycosylase [Pseudomonas sp. 22 E 5]|nr:lytic murein transglycosylase [Pseudomonas sp. 22 E 5]
MKQLPANFDYALADGGIRKSVGEWMRLGIQLPPGASMPPNVEQLSAALLLPAGYRGPAFLVLDNFRAILKYNNSSSYALAVGLLSERFAGGGVIRGDWPKDELPLSRSQRIDLQTVLSAKGYDAGNPDGIIGANTRKAIRAAQQSLGWPADGYPTVKLLESLQSR